MLSTQKCAIKFLMKGNLFNVLKYDEMNLVLCIYYVFDLEKQFLDMKTCQLMFAWRQEVWNRTWEFRTTRRFQKPRVMALRFVGLDLYNNISSIVRDMMELKQLH